MHLTTPIPPYPEGGGGPGNGIELNLGFSDVGSGSAPLEIPTASEVAKPLAVAKLEADKGKLVTQDLEEVPQINPQVAEPKKVKKDIKKTVAEQPDKTLKKEPVKPQPTQPIVNKNALYKGYKNSADGNDKAHGDKGDPNGSLGAKAFGGKGGNGGSGGGTGGGQGTGKGTGTGPGISANLQNRVISLPKPEYKHQVEGTVIVEITVDKDGKVTQAIPGVRGSTTLDESLLQAAQQAAKLANFKTDASLFQKGTITYKFSLQ